nr:allatostatin-A receptor-like [Lytechinus pictus]
MNTTLDFGRNYSQPQGTSLVDILVPRVVFSTVGIVGVIGNALVLAVIGCVKDLRGITNLLIANQSLIDLMASIMLLIFRVVPQMPVHENQPVRGAFICIFFDSKVLFWSTIVSSTFNLVLITFERYYAIIYPLHYRKSATIQRSALVAIVPWILGFANHVYLIFSFKVEDGTCKSIYSAREYAIVGTVSFLIQYIIPLVCIIFAYVRICISLRTRVGDVSLPNGVNQQRTEDTTLQSSGHAVIRTTMESNVTTSGPTTSSGTVASDESTGNTLQRTFNFGRQKTKQMYNNGNAPGNALPSYRNRARKNIINTLLIVSITFFICWTPNQIVFLIFNLGGPVELQGSLYYCTVTMAFCNMCVNPFIYSFKYRRFQKGFKELFKKWTCKCDSSLSLCHKFR